MVRARAMLLSPLLAALLGGCAHYEYDLVQPQELARHVSAKEWTAFRLDELEYRLRTSDNHLVMHVHNLGDRPVKLSGPDSVAVDPHGESHPLRGETILPGTHVVRIFPPPPPQVRPYGSTFGFGVGMASGPYPGGHYHDGFGWGAHYYDDVAPRYYSVYDPNDRTYFEWEGETPVRLLFAYQREGAGDGFRHEFVFRRRKM